MSAMENLEPRAHSGIGTVGPVMTARGSLSGAGFFAATQNIAAGTEWSIRRSADTVVVHLSGPITELKTELRGTAPTREPPMPGEVWVIPADQPYFAKARGGDIQYAELHFEGSALSRIAGRTVLTHPVAPRAGHFDPFLHHATLRLLDLSARSDDLSALAMESLSQTLLFHFRTGYCGEPTTQAMLRHLVLSTREGDLLEEFIEDNLDAVIRLHSLASLVHMTSHELLPAFRMRFGTTPAQYIIQRRLRRARWLLLNSAKSIAAIAFETGFSSHAHLSATFRAHVKMTPQEFRGMQPLVLRTSPQKPGPR